MVVALGKDSVAAKIPNVNIRYYIARSEFAF
jgi:hypothetical protein